MLKVTERSRGNHKLKTNKMANAMQWRYATKRYDSTKKLSEEQVNAVLDAINHAPTAYGLQPYQVVRVRSEEVRAQLSPASYGQPQITEAAELLVFIVPKKLDSEAVDAYMNRIAEVRNVERDALNGFAEYINGTISTLNEDQTISWNAKQAYIGLGFGLAEAAIQQIDSSPMEGFNPQAVNEVLGLTDKTAVVMLALGYRSEEDATQHHKKVRKNLSDLVIIK